MKFILRSTLLTAALAVLAALFAVTAPVASAHSSIVSSNPAEGAVLHTVPAEITLTFNSPVRANPANLTVVDTHNRSIAVGPLKVKGRTVTQKINPKAGKGRYEIRYILLAADGHPSHGTIHFAIA